MSEPKKKRPRPDGDGRRLLSVFALRVTSWSRVKDLKPRSLSSSSSSSSSQRPVDEFGEKIPKRKVALLLGYNGSKYHGLQKQPGETYSTIEGELEKALAAAGLVSESNQGDLSKIGWSRAARTDKTVSAARQIVAAKLLIAGDDVDAAVEKVNAHLPPEIRVFDAVRVTKGFDSKRACDRRHYTYMVPSALLAPPDFVDSVFRDTTDRSVEETRNKISQSREKNEHYDWRLSDEDLEAAAAKLAECRVDRETLAAFREFIAAYQGTHNFHNFTAGMKGASKAAIRYMLKLSAVDPDDSETIEPNRAQWVQVNIIGQSFMLHQIRKMIAVATRAVTLGKSPEILEALFDAENDVNLQLVPGDGLYLGQPIFQSYNQFKVENVKNKLEWTEDHPKFPIIDAFRRDVVEDGIVRGGNHLALKPFVEYLWLLKVFGSVLSPDDPPLPINASIWRQLTQEKEQVDGGDDDHDDDA